MVRVLERNSDFSTDDLFLNIIYFIFIKDFYSMLEYIHIFIYIVDPNFAHDSRVISSFKVV